MARLSWRTRNWVGNGASAWVTLVDLSDEILCSLCVRGSTVGVSPACCVLVDLLWPRGRLAQAKLIFK